MRRPRSGTPRFREGSTDQAETGSAPEFSSTADSLLARLAQVGIRIRIAGDAESLIVTLHVESPDYVRADEILSGAIAGFAEMDMWPNSGPSVTVSIDPETATDLNHAQDRGEWARTQATVERLQVANWNLPTIELLLWTGGGTSFALPPVWWLKAGFVLAIMYWLFYACYVKTWFCGKVPGCKCPEPADPEDGSWEADFPNKGPGGCDFNPATGDPGVNSKAPPAPAGGETFESACGPKSKWKAQPCSKVCAFDQATGGYLLKWVPTAGGGFGIKCGGCK